MPMVTHTPRNPSSPRYRAVMRWHADKPVQAVALCTLQHPRWPLILCGTPAPRAAGGTQQGRAA